MQPQSKIIQNSNILTVASEIHIYPFSMMIYFNILISVISYVNFLFL